jgi:hypothetical protein
MKNYFDKTAFKFLLAFALIIVASLFVLGVASRRADEQRVQAGVTSSKQAGD